MGNYFQNFIAQIPELILRLPALLMALSMHELAHGYVSYKLGDPTPKSMGRLTANPLAHLDPIGTICLLLFRFGWAKPVMINTGYYKNQKLGIIAVSLAGPITNFILAFVNMLILGIMGKFVAPTITSWTFGDPVWLYNTVYSIFYAGVTLNIGLGLFNLIPVPPLDGSKVLLSVLPYKAYNFVLKYEGYGSLILMALLFTGALDGILTGGLMWVFNGMANVVNAVF